MDNNIKYKSIDIKDAIKADNGNLEITGYGAFFGNVDSYGDIIEKGAFNNTIEERKDRIAFCYQHDIYNPIGKIVELKEDDNGLFIKVVLSAAEKDIQTKIKEGILKEMSIGYSVVSSKADVIEDKQINRLNELKLYEISLVTVAANPLAIIEGMKSEDRANYLNDEFDRFIATIRNEAIKYEAQKLKSIIFSVPVETHIKEEPLKEEGLTKTEILKILQNG